MLVLESDIVILLLLLKVKDGFYFLVNIINVCWLFLIKDLYIVGFSDKIFDLDVN